MCGVRQVLNARVRIVGGRDNNDADSASLSYFNAVFPESTGRHQSRTQPSRKAHIRSGGISVAITHETQSDHLHIPMDEREEQSDVCHVFCPFFRQLSLTISCRSRSLMVVRWISLLKSWTSLTKMLSWYEYRFHRTLVLTLALGRMDSGLCFAYYILAAIFNMFVLVQEYLYDTTIYSQAFYFLIHAGHQIIPQF